MRRPESTTSVSPALRGDEGPSLHGHGVVSLPSPKLLSLKGHAPPDLDFCKCRLDSIAKGRSAHAQKRRGLAGRERRIGERTSLEGAGRRFDRERSFSNLREQFACFALALDAPRFHERPVRCFTPGGDHADRGACLTVPTWTEAAPPLGSCEVSPIGRPRRATKPPKLEKSADMLVGAVDPRPLKELDRAPLKQRGDAQALRPPTSIPLRTDLTPPRPTRSRPSIHTCDIGSAAPVGPLA